MNILSLLQIAVLPERLYLFMLPDVRNFYSIEYLLQEKISLLP